MDKVTIHIHQEVVLGCKNGDRTSQFELYKLYSKAMYNICMRMLNDETWSEDILQECFISIFKNIHTFNFNSTIGAWIKRIVINTCINELKKKRVDLIMTDNELILEKQQLTSSEEINLQYQIDTVKDAIHTLPDGYRVILSLYLLEGYDHQEIAEILGISESTSKSQYHRAKKKLKSMINETS